MAIALRQLQQVVEGSGGNVKPRPALNGYAVNLPSGLVAYGVLTELSQLGLESEHVTLFGERSVWISSAGVTV